MAVRIDRGLNFIFLSVYCSLFFEVCASQYVDSTFCAQNTTESTLKTFWLEAHSGCPKDAFKLLNTYEQMINSKESKCNQLFRHLLRKSLIESSATIYEEALITRSFAQSDEVKRLSKRLAYIEQSSAIVESVWEHVISAVYLFMSRVELLEALSQNIILESKVVSFIQLLNKYNANADFDTLFPIRLMSLVDSLVQDDFQRIPAQLKVRFMRIFGTSYQQLKLLQSGKRLCLLNSAHWEFLYAPRDNGPDNKRRLPLTWTKEKNAIDSDGEFELEVRNQVEVAFGSLYDGVLKFLIVDELLRQPFFWIGDDSKESKWWTAYWYGSYFIFVNSVTKDILCATKAYDENRRYVTLEKVTQHDALNESSFISRLECRWTFTEPSSN